MRLPLSLGAASSGLAETHNAATLLKHADAAMYSAKQAGKNAYRFFKSVAAANDGRAASAQSENTGSV